MNKGHHLPLERGPEGDAFFHDFVYQCISKYMSISVYRYIRTVVGAGVPVRNQEIPLADQKRGFAASEARDHKGHHPPLGRGPERCALLLFLYHSRA